MDGTKTHPDSWHSQSFGALSNLVSITSISAVAGDG